MFKALVCLALVSCVFSLEHNFTKHFSMNLEIRNNDYVLITLTLQEKLPDYHKNMYMGVGFGARTMDWADLYVVKKMDQAFTSHDLYGQGEEYDGSITNKDDTTFGGTKNIWIKGDDAGMDTAIYEVNGVASQQLNYYSTKDDIVVAQFARKLSSGDTSADLTLRKDDEYNMFWFYFNNGSCRFKFSSINRCNCSTIR